MGTPFSQVRDFMRALLDDYGLENPSDPDYTNTALNHRINLALAMLNNDSLDSVETPEIPPEEEGDIGVSADWEFTSELTRGQRALVALKSTETLIVLAPTDFSYKTPVHSVSRKGGGLSALRSFIDLKLRELQGRSLVLETQNEFEYYFSYPSKALQALTDGYSQS